MPVIENSAYRAPVWLRSGHLQTIAGAFRRAPQISYARERIETPDGDFLDIDWAIPRGGKRLVIVSYGMESEPSSPYVRCAVAALLKAGFDALVWNYRGCSGEPNRKLHFYHGGFIDDLDSVMNHAISRGYDDIRLAGFSLGGNLTLNYLGHRAESLPSAIRRAAVFSVPVEVADCAVQMRKKLNQLYVRLFLKSFRQKIRAKMSVMPDAIDDHNYGSIASLEEYDARYTVPHFGFESVADMYRKVSSLYVIDKVRVPTLIVNALDDPFMGEKCFPVEAARNNPNITLELPRHGGHLGFLECGGSWMEKRLLESIRG
jgi:predicted alpha/beta-fold hydrolase